MKTLFSPSAESRIIALLERIAISLEHYTRAYDAVAAQSGVVTTPVAISKPENEAVSSWVGVSDDLTTAIREAEEEARALGLKPPEEQP